MKKTEINLKTIPNDPEHFLGKSKGDTDDLAKMIVAFLIYNPRLLKKVFKQILVKIGEEKKYEQFI